MSLQDVLYKLSKIESAVDNINLRLCSLESNLVPNNSLRSINQRIPRNIFYSPNLQRQTPVNINQPLNNQPLNNQPLNNQPLNNQPLNNQHNQNNQEQTYVQPSLFSYFNTRNPRRTEQIEISSNPGTNLFDTLFPELNRRSESLQNHRTINQHTELSVYFNEDTEDNEDNEDICTICQEVIQNNSITRKIKKCNHFFHSTCLDKWLENHITCPTCRQDIRENTQDQNNQESSNRNRNLSSHETMI
jgi:hypothetical protein